MDSKPLGVCEGPNYESETLPLCEECLIMSVM